jgi:nitrite reductase/ring-hydroxylating ferredoxin subunit
MGEQQSTPSGPDLTQGVPLSEFKDDKLLGHVGDSDVLVVRTAKGLYAVDAYCTHYHGPLADGLVVGESIRCPWHHACFDLQTGEASCAPAFSPLSRWKVEERGGKIYVSEKIEQKPSPKRPNTKPDRIVIVGGAAVLTAASRC